MKNNKDQARRWGFFVKSSMGAIYFVNYLDEKIAKESRKALIKNGSQCSKITEINGTF